MNIFSRFRRGQEHDDEGRVPDVLPSVNQRVTVFAGSGNPVASRIDDEDESNLVIASPNLPLVPGEIISLSWESEEGGWFRLESRVQQIDEEAIRPTVAIAKRGRVSRFDERRSDLRRKVDLPIELRAVTARVVKAGLTLTTKVTEISPQALRFATSAPFAPGDLIEARITLPGSDEPVSTRLKVIRVDSVSDSWKHVVTGIYDEILRSDRARLVSYLELRASEPAERV